MCPAPGLSPRGTLLLLHEVPRRLQEPARSSRSGRSPPQRPRQGPETQDPREGARRPLNGHSEEGLVFLDLAEGVAGEIGHYANFADTSKRNRLEAAEAV